MKIANAAKYFDRTIATDAYGSAQVNVQFDLWADSLRDGPTVERRTVSAAPAVVMPTRRVLSVEGKQWIIGDGAEDYFNGKTMRVKYVAHQATGLATVTTVDQLLSGQSGATMYAGLAWVKAARQIEVNSDLINVFTLYYSVYEDVSEGKVVLLNGKYYWSRGRYDALSGLRATLVDELPDPLEIITFRSNVYDPITDTNNATTVATTVLRMRWQEHFAYPAKSSQTYERGDEVVFVLESASLAKANDTLIMSDGTWRVLSATDEGSVRSLHIRKV